MNTACAIKELFTSLRNGDKELHALTVYCGGKKIFSGAAKPYTEYQKNHVYSLSKSFCSTAVGLACDMGYLSLDDKIIDIFPEKVPENVSENTKKMTLRHVLSMNTGHDGCVMTRILPTDDPVAAFLSLPPEHEPGTHFAYNTGATYIASACVTKKTGLTVLDLLERRLFCHMDICGSEWFSAHGFSEGGVGFNVCCDDAAKLGLLYLNGGIWNGKRLLSEEYVQTAQTAISDNSGNGNPDWCAGYGLQFWRNYRGGFRGDGAFGQVCIVYPEKNIVIAAIAECGDMQSEMDCFFDFINALDNDPAPIGNELDSFLEEFYEADKINADDVKFVGKAFALDENPCGFSSVRFDKTPCGINAVLTSCERVNVMEGVSGEWTYGVMRGAFVMPMLDALTLKRNRDLEYFSCARTEGDALIFTLRGINCPHKITYKFEVDGENIKISRIAGKCGGYHAEFTGKEIKI